MSDTTQNINNSVVVLFKGGRLPTWHRVSRSDQKEYERIHVELMLEVVQKYDLIGIQGYKLLGPQKSWEKFWVIEFPTLDGATEWIKAEMAPPYGSYGKLLKQKIPLIQTICLIYVRIKIAYLF